MWTRQEIVIRTVTGMTSRVRRASLVGLRRKPPEGMRRSEMAVRRPPAITLLVLLSAALVALAFATVPELRYSLKTFAHLNWAWLPLALLAESGSMASFARNQQHLLKVSGHRITLRSSMAIAYASNAVSLSLPVVGTGLGTAFAYRQFRRRGADHASVGWALTVSGIVSSLAFALLMFIGALLSNSTGATALGFFGAAATALPMLVILAALRFGAIHRLINRLVAQAVRISRRLFHHPHPEAALAFEELLTRIGRLRATPVQYGYAFYHALRNWGGDCLCLVCAIAAAGGPVPWHGILLAYCLGVTAGSFGLTPGGIGVVEAALTAALVNAGLPASRAVPAVLLYRLVSLWLVIAIGGLVAGVTARRHRRQGVPTGSAPPDTRPVRVPDHDPDAEQ